MPDAFGNTACSPPQAVRVVEAQNKYFTFCVGRVYL